MEAPKQRILNRWESLKSDRLSWLDHWRDLSEQIRPRGSRYISADVNTGKKVNSHIINGTPTWAARTLAAGMMSGITSPARPWFRLTTSDPDLGEVASIKTWLYKVEERIKLILHKSNFYNSLHIVYSDLGVISTAAMHIDEDPERTIRCYVFPPGRYALANSEKGEVDTLYRDASFSVRQLVRKFGLDACSNQVKSLWKEKQYDKWVDCLHAIEPRDDLKPGSLGPSGMRWSSTWIELTGDSKDVLKEGGYNEFPVMAPRWFVTGEDVYGTGPGMDVLGDCRALQVLEKRKGNLVNKIADPPLAGPSSIRNLSISLLPGAVNPVDSVGTQRLEPIYQPNPLSIQVVGAEIEKHEERIKRGFYADLWLMLSQSAASMTAREVAERHEEKLLQLGTVLEQVHTELLDPAISRVYSIALRAGLIPPPPREAMGADLKVEYISIMAQAQKLLGTTAIERLSSFTAQAASVAPQVLDKVDWDQTIDEYSVMLGVPPIIVRPDEDVAKIRGQRAKAAAQQKAMEQAGAAADTAKSLASADTSGENALTTMLRGLGAPGGA